MMLTNQSGMLGMAAGQLSGVRPGTGQSRGRTNQQTAAKPRGTASHARWLGGRYFNRTQRQPSRSQPHPSKLLQTAKSLLSASCPLRRIRLFSI